MGTVFYAIGTCGLKGIVLWVMTKKPNSREFP